MTLRVRGRSFEAIEPFLVPPIILAITVSFVSFLPLLAALGDVNREAFTFFRSWLAPAAALHLAVLLAVSLRFPGRAWPVWLLWAVSLAALLAAGGPIRAATFVLLVIGALVLVALGDPIERSCLPESARCWGARLGFGILAVSFIGSLLAALGDFTPLIAGLVLLAFSMLVWRGRWRSPGTGLRAAGLRLSARWELSHALAGEAVFAVFAFAFVAATAPESRSDALRVYWPYVRVLQQFGGFVDVPSQWGFVIPQPGLAYAASVSMLLGPLVVRYSMLLALLALAGILAARSASEHASVGTALAVVVASCPIVMWTSLSLYQEAFVCLATVLLALVCLEGDRPGSARHWAQVGALAGIAWCAKYSTAAYAAPLLAWAFVRGRGEGSGRNLLRAMVYGATACLAAAGPWLWHAFDQSGNPVFPFLRGLFPAALWPEPVGTANLADFALPEGLRGALLWPFELTFHTDRFVEAPPGSLGIVVPALLAFALAGWLEARPAGRGWLVAGSIGTAALWQFTAYVRYWLPGLWLVAIGSVRGAISLSRSPRRRLAFSAAALVLAVLHLPFVMASSWGVPSGWPWELYRGATDEDSYLLRLPGVAALRRLETLDAGWPKLWYTGTELGGHIRAIPLAAAAWEFRIHGATDAASIDRHLESAGCDYWVVDPETPSADQFRKLGVADRYWTPENLVDSEGPLEIYRMPSSRRAAALVASRPPRALVDLLANGGFEEKGDDATARGWEVVGGRAQRILSASDARQGEAVLEVAEDGVVIQALALPAAARSLRLSEWVRAAEPGKSVRLQVAWSDAGGRFLSADVVPVPAKQAWKRYALTARVPARAAHAVVYLTSHAGAGSAMFDDVRLDLWD